MFSEFCSCCLQTFKWGWQLRCASLVAQWESIHLPSRRQGFNPWFRKIPWRRAWQPTPILLPGEFPRTEEPGGLQPMGSQRVGHILTTEQQRQLIRSFLSFFLRNPRTFGLDRLPTHPSGGWSTVDSPVCPGIGGGGIGWVLGKSLLVLIFKE